MFNAVPYLGEILSLLCAIVWALAVILFRKSGEKVHPLALNTFKNLVATVLLIPTMWLFNEALFSPAPLNVYVLLLLSGALGIGIGDTLLFMSLNSLGAGLTGIVVCMYSPFIICLSVLFLAETLTWLQIAGAVLIVSAILVATLEKRKKSMRRNNLIIGTILGVLASAAMAVGIVMIKPILNETPIVWAMLIRLFGGIIVLLIIFLVIPKRKILVQSLITTKKWTYTISGSVIGAYLAMIIWLAGMKYTQVSIASALNQTSTIFIFIFAGMFLKEPIDLKRTIGISLAFAGSLLVFFG
jgi:drug/metabolite transporter (DMT)-like permease